LDFKVNEILGEEISKWYDEVTKKQKEYNEAIQMATLKYGENSEQVLKLK
jgi:AICAR transformylase/IMP cyclohydrolase PurH